jgi:hypothetical protein
MISYDLHPGGAVEIVTFGDQLHALPNYHRRGFRTFKVEQGVGGGDGQRSSRQAGAGGELTAA